MASWWRRWTPPAAKEPGDRQSLGHAEVISGPGGLPGLRAGEGGVREADGGAAEPQHRLSGGSASVDRPHVPARPGPIELIHAVRGEAHLPLAAPVMPAKLRIAEREG